MPKLKLSILIPARNEEMNIKIMLKVLHAIMEVPHEILVICDSPEDTTIPVVRNIQKDYTNIKLIYNNYGQGVINAVNAGIKASEGEYILIFAADEIGPVLAIDDMISLLDEGCDLVSCTRYAYGGRRLGGSLIGGILSRLANKLFYVLSGSMLTDATTGIKMFKKKVLDQIILESRPIGWAFIFELAIKVQSKKMKLGEVPIISIDRLYGGKSTFSLGPWIREYLRWFIWGLRHIPKFRKTEKPQIRIPKTTAY